MFSPDRSSQIVFLDPTDADAEPGWDAVLRELATEPGLDVEPLYAPVARTAPPKARGGFGGMLDLLLIAGAVSMGIVVAAVGTAVFLYS